MTSRPALISDATSIAAIYSAGILERVATFETEPRAAKDVAVWFESPLPKIVVEEDGRVVAFAAAFPYSDPCCYTGVAEFSVYVAPDFRHRGAGRLAMEVLIKASAAFGLHKLLSRVFPENEASLCVLESVGFRTVGVHQKHGKLDGKWRDVVAVERLIPENL